MNTRATKINCSPSFISNRRNYKLFINGMKQNFFLRQKKRHGIICWMLERGTQTQMKIFHAGKK